MFWFSNITISITNITILVQLYSYFCLTNMTMDCRLRRQDEEDVDKSVEACVCSQRWELFCLLVGIHVL